MFVHLEVFCFFKKSVKVPPENIVLICVILANIVNLLVTVIVVFIITAKCS